MKDFEPFTADEIPCLATAQPDIIVRFLASRAFTRDEVSRMLGIDIERFTGLADAYEVGRRRCPSERTGEHFCECRG